MILLGVSSITAPGKVAFLFELALMLSQRQIRNTSNITKTNIGVGLGVTGANTYNQGTSNNFLWQPGATQRLLHF